MTDRDFRSGDLVIVRTSDGGQPGVVLDGRPLVLRVLYRGMVSLVDSIRVRRPTPEELLTLEWPT